MTFAEKQPRRKIELFYDLDCLELDAYGVFYDFNLPSYIPYGSVYKDKMDQISIMMSPGSRIQLFKEKSFEERIFDYKNESDEERCINLFSPENTWG